MEAEKIIAMATACIAEELEVDIRKVRVVSFREVQKSDLEKYIEENEITYRKYQLEDEIS